MVSFVSYYIPSFKAGGPVKTIKNMIEQLDDFQFFVITRDRDLGDKKPFSNVKFGSWQKLGNACVMYLSPKSQSLWKLAKTINKTEFDLLYLNSFFDFSFTIKPLLARRMRLVRPCPIILAPRGEFSQGALAIKPIKKKLFIKLSGWLGLYKGVIWQASTDLEKSDIIRALNVSLEDVLVARDLPPGNSDEALEKDLTLNEVCKVVFLSRISPIKNLLFALKAISYVKADVIFDIYGPIEDEGYWKTCVKLMEKMPENIKVRYFGPVLPDQVADVFSGYDLFLFPTLGENYGHVIAESLVSGTPVLLSDQTPWRGLARYKLGWDLSLEAEAFSEKINQVAEMEPVDRLSWRKKVYIDSSKLINKDKDIEDNVRLFESALDFFNKG